MKRKIIDAIKKFLQKKGYDIVRHRPFLELITMDRFDLVLDVGANEGQFASELRKTYKGKIISFEPVWEAFEKISLKSKLDPNWDCYNMALGDVSGELVLNVYNDTILSSFHKHNELNISQQMRVRVRTINDILDEVAQDAVNILIKIDTQGYEIPILNGATKVMNRIEGILLELSISPLYIEQPLFESVVNFLKDKGFVLWTTKRGLYDFKTSREIERDGLFLKQ
jgi:FkbM family methyltransferase